MAGLREPAVASCIAAGIERHEREGPGRQPPPTIKITLGTFPAPRIAGGVLLRERITKPSGSVFPGVSYTDELDFLIGQAKVSLRVASAGQPPSAAAERRLLTLLYRRATSAHL
jgi:hypothetical protein